MDSCSNCVLLIKELNHLRRQISLLNTMISNSENNCNNIHLNAISQKDNNSVSSCHKDSQTDPSFYEPLETDSESSCISPISSLNYLCQNISLNDKLNVFSFDTENHELVEPCSIMQGKPFENVDLKELDQSTIYSTNFHNRLVAHYGAHSYTYGGVTHQPAPFSTNSGLVKLLNLVDSVLPELSFNSVLITKYPNGKYHLPYHSDDEESICDDSQITTISLGQSRAVKFRSVAEKGSELLINISHGQVYSMSKKSQKLFEHCIPKDYTKEPRISITLRNLIPHTPILSTETATTVGGSQILSKINEVQLSIPLPLNTLCDFHHSPHGDSLSTVNGDTGGPPSLSAQEKSVTVYISSSMFRYLDQNKLSSPSQDCHVYFYPGATSGQMLHRFKSDPNVGNFNPSSVAKVMLLTGTNNIDWIAGDSTGENIFQKTTFEITEMINYLKTYFTNATIGLINILPRKSYQRNLAINKVNRFLLYLSHQLEYVEFINTELDRNLFSTNQGFRKSYYFIPDTNKIQDNVHLNRFGVSRLAKHLKFISHNM